MKKRNLGFARNFMKLMGATLAASLLLSVNVHAEEVEELDNSEDIATISDGIDTLDEKVDALNDNCQDEGVSDDISGMSGLISILNETISRLSTDYSKLLMTIDRNKYSIINGLNKSVYANNKISENASYSDVISKINDIKYQGTLDVTLGGNDKYTLESGYYEGGTIDVSAIVEAVRVEAYNAGKADGYKEGKEEGLKEGITEGIKSGRDEGVKAGKEEGFKAGKEEGLKEGKEEGFNAGKEEGLKEGKEEGFNAGKEEGLKEGKEEGFNAGKEEGLKEGKEEGFNAGKEEGLKEGKEEGIKEGKDIAIIENKQTWINEGKRLGDADGYARGIKEVNSVAPYYTTSTDSTYVIPKDGIYHLYASAGSTLQDNHYTTVYARVSCGGSIKINATQGWDHGKALYAAGSWSGYLSKGTVVSMSAWTDGWGSNMAGQMFSVVYGGQ